MKKESIFTPTFVINTLISFLFYIVFVFFFKQKCLSKTTTRENDVDAWIHLFDDVATRSINHRRLEFFVRCVRRTLPSESNAGPLTPDRVCSGSLC